MVPDDPPAQRALDAAREQLSLAQEELARAVARLDSVQRVPLPRPVAELRAELAKAEALIGESESLVIAYQRTLATREYLRTQIAAWADLRADLDSAEGSRLAASERVTALKTIIDLLEDLTE